MAYMILLLAFIIIITKGISSLVVKLAYTLMV